ncbi:MAG: hypothetical protein JRJ84_16010 [Deltaproteobacteria bacterium]|nr:hypothetical protein [Deltaproteobacteria bacterium]
MNLATLRTQAPADLEHLYAHEDPFDVPEGLFRGVYLGRIGALRERTAEVRLAEIVGFRWTPFWVDFARRCWAFFTPRLGAGRFSPHIDDSRWRPTRTVVLDYGASRLPGPVRRILYDEVKPLSGDLCLGMGGVNRGPGNGDLFFFALVRVC